MDDVTTGTLKLDWGELIRKPSVIFLILMNLVPLVGVLAWGWDVGFLMLIYWVETVVIGLFNIPRLLTSGLGASDFGWAVFGNLFLVAFFSVHYGMFNFGHFMFLKGMFNLPPLLDNGVMVAVGGLSLSHLFSLIVNWFGKREYRSATPNAQMFKPYGRVIVMHVTILIGGVFAAMGGGVMTLALLIVLKTGSDVLAHAVSHGWRPAPQGVG